MDEPTLVSGSWVTGEKVSGEGVRGARRAALGSAGRTLCRRTATQMVRRRGSWRGFPIDDVKVARTAWCGWALLIGGGGDAGHEAGDLIGHVQDIGNDGRH